MGFFITAAVVVAAIGLCAHVFDEPMFRRLAAHDAADAPIAPPNPVPIAAARPGAVCEVAGRITRISARPREEPGTLFAALDDGDAEVGVRLPSSVAGFIHTGELLSVTGVLVQADEEPQIEPLTAAIVGEAGWTVQLPLQTRVERR
jgi:hypothetical protein